MVTVAGRFGIALNATKGQRGYFGVSICSRFFSKVNVVEMSRWCSEFFDQFLIIIADDPQAFTFMATKQLDFETALLKARQIGLERFTSITKWLRSSGIKNATLLRWRDISSDRVFKRTLKEVNICFTKNSAFREDVFHQIHSRDSRLPDDQEVHRIRDEFLDTAALYVTNEIAVMAYLQEFSKPPWSIQVFPLPMPPALVGLYQENYCPKVGLHSERSGYIQIKISE